MILLIKGKVGAQKFNQIIGPCVYSWPIEVHRAFICMCPPILLSLMPDNFTQQGQVLPLDELNLSHGQ